MKKTIFFLLLFSLSVYCAATNNQVAGARPRALSNAFVSVSDVWSTFHNQAGLAGLSRVNAAIYYESRFSVDVLALAAGTLMLPVKAGNFGISFAQFGKGSYKENKVGLAFAKQLSDKISAAVQLDYLSQTFPENERAKGFATFEAGMIYAATEKLFLGAHIFNPVQGGIETLRGKQKSPVVLRIGAHQQFSNAVLLVAEAEKSSEIPMVVKTGLEFSPAQHLFLRFGVSAKPVSYSAGIGYRVDKVSTNIAFSYHGILGLTPSVSLQVAL